MSTGPVTRGRVGRSTRTIDGAVMRNENELSNIQEGNRKEFSYKALWPILDP